MILWAIFGYLLGSVPFGLVITRALGLGDLRQIGSGNIGATNVLRTGNKGAALATLLLDRGKGAIAVLLARHFGGRQRGDAGRRRGLPRPLRPDLATLLRRQGRRNVPRNGDLAELAFGPDRLRDLGADRRDHPDQQPQRASGGRAGRPVVACGLADRTIVVASRRFMAVLIFIRHHANISRLLAGTEPRIGRK